MTIEIWERRAGEPGWWARLALLSAGTGILLGMIGYLSGDLLFCLYT